MLDVLSPDERAVAQFTNFFVAEIQAESIFIKRVSKRESDDDEVDDYLAKANLFLNIGLFDHFSTDHPLDVHFNIDPPISAGHAHVYTFSSRGERDYIDVQVGLRQVNCALYDGQQTKLIQESFNQKRAIDLEQGGILGGKFITKTEVEDVLANLSDPLWQESISSPKNKKKMLGKSQKQYALLVKGLGEPRKNEISSYILEGRIRLGELVEV